MKKNRDKVENMTPMKQLGVEKTQERITPRSKKFKIDNDTVENVTRTGNKLLANWKCLVQEKEEAIQKTLNKLQNMQPSKRSDNRLRQEIEQHIDFQEADRHVMKRCMKNLQISIKDKLNYLRKQKKFLLDYQKTLENVYNTTEKNKRLRIPDPFPKFLLDVRREHYHMFNEELLISSNEGINKYKRKMIEANTVSIGSTRIYFGRTGRADVMTPIHENKLESDKCITGQCVDSCCTCHRSDSELSFLNHELDTECKIYETIEESKVIENGSRQETQRNVLEKLSQESKIPIPVKLLPLLANKKINYVEKLSSTPVPVKLPLLSTNKNMKYVEDWPSATRKRKPLLPNQKIQYVKEPAYTTPKLPPLLHDKEQKCMQEKSFTYRPGTPKIIQPLNMLPQNIKKTTASGKMLNMSSELALKTVRWSNNFRYFSLHRASGKDCYIPERKFRYSRLHKSSGKDCYIPKSKSDKVSKIVYERYCTTGKQKRNFRKQTEREKPDSYPKSDRFHTLPKNFKETLILNKIRNKKKDRSKVMSPQLMSISAPQQTAETTASGGMLDMSSDLALKRVRWNNNFRYFRLYRASDKDCYIPERKFRYSRLHKSSGKDCYIPKSKSDKVSKIVYERYCTTGKQKKNARKQTEREKPDSYPEPDQFHTLPQNRKMIVIVHKTRDEKKDKSKVTSSQSMPIPAPQQTNETAASNKMSKSALQQADETTASNNTSKSELHQANEQTASNKMSKSAPQQTDETTASNKMSTSALQQTAETTASNKMSTSALQQTDETTASNTMSKSAPQQTDETTTSNEILNMSSELALKRYCTTRKQKRNVTKLTESDSYLEPDQYHTMLDIEVADEYPNEDIFHKLDDMEMIGFYQVQEKNLLPIIENMSDNKVIELYEKLYDQHIAVTQSISNTVNDTQSSSSGSTIDDFQDGAENDGVLKTTIKTFVKKLIPDCLTNSNQCQPTETLSSNWQILKIRSGTDIKTQYIPKPPNTPKPKTSSSRRHRYRRKNDENNNQPET